jgi:hypothetical protein
MSAIDNDLEALFNRVADGIASEADEERLGLVLRSSSEARRAYREFTGVALGAALGLCRGGSSRSAPNLSHPVSHSLATARVRWAGAFFAGIAVATAAAIAVVVFWQNHSPNAQYRDVAKEAKPDVIACVLG